MDKKIFKKTPEELQEYFKFKRHGYRSDTINRNALVKSHDIGIGRVYH